MQVPGSVEIGIREIRQLTSFIKETHGVDFTEYALNSFKRRIERVLENNKFGFETLLKKLESKTFMDQFIGQATVGDSELFRDPTFWVLLKNIYLANIFKEQSKIRIWVPMCVSGEEFYSLAILLKENNWTQRAEIYLSSISDESLNQIRKGRMETSKLEISSKNYVRFQGHGQFTDYYKMTNEEVIFNPSLLTDMQTFKQNLNFDNDLPPMHLILFRNRMIYFNPTLQYKVCDILHGKLAAKGLLALGILEEIEMNVNNKYIALNKEESIYQRKN